MATHLYLVPNDECRVTNSEAPRTNRRNQFAVIFRSPCEGIRGVLDDRRSGRASSINQLLHRSGNNTQNNISNIDPDVTG